MAERLDKVRKLLSRDVPSPQPLSARELRAKLWRFVTIYKRK